MFFILGTGRCGSQTLAATLSEQTNATCAHEPEPALIHEATQYRYGQVGAGVLSRLLRKTRPNEIDGCPYGESNHKLSMVIPLLADTFPDAKYLWLVRNGLDVVASLVGRQWYTWDSRNRARYEDCPADAKMWIDGRIEGDRCGDVDAEQWALMTPFEKCCWYWSYVNRVIESDLADLAKPESHRLVRLERIDADLATAAEWLGLKRTGSLQAGIHNSATYERYECGQWSVEERRVFIKWCGPLMDRLYPGWRDRFREAYAQAGPVQSTVAQKAAGQGPGDVGRLIEEGEQLCERGDLNAAYTRFEQALALEPAHLTAYNNLAAVCWEMGDIGQSLEYLTRALEVDDQDRCTLINLFPVLITVNQEELLRSLYQGYVGRHPDDQEFAARLQALLNVAEGDAGDVAGADSYTGEAFATESDALVAKGEDYYRDGNLGNAQQCFAQALECDPDHISAHIDSGAVYWAQGQHGEALEAFARALQLDPKHRDAVTNCANAAAELGFIDAARDVYRSYLSHRPDDDDIQERLQGLDARGAEPSPECALDDPAQLLNQGESFYKGGDLERARDSFERVLKLEPDNVDALNNLGTVCWESGDAGGAVQYFADALEHRPDHPEAAINCAEVLTASGYTEEAAALRKTAAGSSKG